MAGTTSNYKLVLLGESSVGKSAIVERRTSGNFVPHSESTIGAAFKHLIMPEIEQNGVKYNVRFEIWDTAGQERYRSLAPMYYRNCDCAIIVYDISNQKSYEEALTWVSTLGQNVVIGLVGNKLDLVDETLGGDPSKRAVAYQTTKDYAKMKGLKFWETSAKEGINIEELFLGLAQGLQLDKKQTRKADVVSLQKADNEMTLQGQCC